jgi:hypothetical protein
VLPCRRQIRPTRWQARSGEHFAASQIAFRDATSGRGLLVPRGDRAVACMWRNDRQATTSHAQQDGRAVGVLTWRKPANVVGCAILTLQHGFQAFSREIRRPARFGLLVAPSCSQIPLKANDVPRAPEVAHILLPDDDKRPWRYNLAKRSRRLTTPASCGRRR